MNGKNLGKARMASDEELERALKDELGAQLVDLSLVPTSGSAGASLPFSWSSAKSYYNANCQDGNACPSGEYSLDCTHFVCHGLSAGGVQVENPTATCDSSLAIRVADLAAGFKNAKSRYSNVKRITDFAGTKAGDFCFIVSWFGFSKDHAMVAAERVSETGGRVWGHTNPRCNEMVGWADQTLVIYRIE